MSEERAAAFREALRRDLGAFVHRTFLEVATSTDYVHAWYADAIAYALTRCFERKTKRLIINMPPRYGKSISASVAFVAWALGRDPTEKIICASYNEELGSGFARDTRQVMQSRWYREAFPQTQLSGRQATHDFHTISGGGRFATSVGGTLTGVGGTIVIIDDPNKAEDGLSEAGRARVREWYRSTLSTRLNDRRTGVIIIVQQRLHAEDLSGYLIESGEGWEQLILPAIATHDERIPIGLGMYHHRREGDLLHPVREDREALERQRRVMGSQLFAAQFQQDPVPLDGAIINWSWFKFFDPKTLIAEPPFNYVQSWDTAMKAGELNDYSVGTTWLMQNGNYYLMDVLRTKALFPDLKRQVIEYAQKWGARTLLIEDKGSGTSLIDVLIDEDPAGVPRPIRRLPQADKVTRMFAQTNAIENGRVFLPLDAPWLAAFRSEMLQFPNARHDDQVDSVSMFLEWATEKPKSEFYFGNWR